MSRQSVRDMNRSHKIYLDYAATTPVDPRVIDAMLPYFGQVFGNPSSVHRLGQQSEAALETARETVAQLLNCQPNEIVFTSCGTESDNLALRGVALAARRDRGAQHILISPVEHHAVSNTAAQLAELHGFEVELLPVDANGMVHPDEVAGRLRPNTAVVSVIYANNEIGTINPLAEIGEICAEHGVPFHTDAVQAAAYLEVDGEKQHVNLMSIGAHKFYGPKGVGALFIRQGTAIRHPRPDPLIGQVLEKTPHSRLPGPPPPRLPNHASFVFAGIDGNALLMMLDLEGFACSSGSACKTGDPEPSEVLTALGLSRSWALGSLRVSVGRRTASNEIGGFCHALPDVVARLRAGETVQA